MKRIIRKYLQKHLKHNPKNYHFLRWLAEVVKDDVETKDVIRTIAYFLDESMLNIPYTDIFLVGNRVYIVTVRPGLWIGKGGAVVDRLLKKMNYGIDGKKHSDYDIDFVCPKDSAVMYILNTQATSFRK